MVYWWYFYYWTSFALATLVLPTMIGYLQAADFSKRGRFVSALKYNLPYYGLYIILFVAFVLFMYLSSVGKRIR